MSGLTSNQRARLFDNAFIGGFDACWLWTGTLTRGYGGLKVGGVTKRAHRVIYEALRGPVPKGSHVHHLCRDKRCVNPKHLTVLTPAEHMRTHPEISEAGSDVGRHKTVCVRGHALTPENVTIDRGWRVCRQCQRERGRRSDAQPSAEDGGEQSREKAPSA